MRTAIMFDTLEYMDDLKRAGMDQEIAEGVTKATQKAFNQMVENKDIATKSDIGDIRNDIMSMKIEFVKFSTETMWKTIGIMSAFQTVVLGLFALIHYVVK